MALFVEIISGDEKGQKFKLVSGVRIGRTTGEIILSEPKMSALHAHVRGSENGKLYLIDSGSHNGIKVRGTRVQKVALMPGVIFQIGKTKFKVFEEIDSIQPPEPATDESWQGIIKSSVPHMEAQNTVSRVPVLPFTTILELHFLEGLQADQVVVLGYGPRKAGSAVLDIELLDPQAPEIAFEIQPLEDGRVLFQTQHPELVLLNDNSFSAESLKAGDQIRVGTSLIEVRFVV